MAKLCYFCQKPCRRPQFHHLKPRSEGGIRTVPAHRKCHVAHHVANNDFARWGQRGGQRSAQNGHWINTLRFGAYGPRPELRRKHANTLD